MWRLHFRHGPTNFSVSNGRYTFINVWKRIRNLRFTPNVLCEYLKWLSIYLENYQTYFQQPIVFHAFPLTCLVMFLISFTLHWLLEPKAVGLSTNLSGKRGVVPFYSNKNKTRGMTFGSNLHKVFATACWCGTCDHNYLLLTLMQS